MNLTTNAGCFYHMNEKIGIDIGNVLTKRDTDIHPFGEDYLNVQAHDGAFEAVAKLVGWFGRTNVFLVSKCSSENQKKSKAWLTHRNFFNMTDVPEENVCFCVERSEKRRIAEHLQLNYFVDDRWTVLSHLTSLDSIKKMYLFNPVLSEKALFDKEYQENKIRVVESWRQIVDDVHSNRRQHVSAERIPEKK